MKRIHSFLVCLVMGISLLAAVLLTTACATKPLSLDDKIGVAIQEVTAGRQAVTELLKAKRISVDADKAFQADLDVVRATLFKAQGMTLSDPAQATALLAEALNQLAALTAAQGAQK